VSIILHRSIIGIVILSTTTVFCCLPAGVDAQTDAQPSTGVSTPEQSAQEQAADGQKLADLDIDQLAKTPVVVPSMDLPVTSVTKEESTVGRSAAAIFVITPEMIRRSGATCIPEVLRMAPGLEVARINGNKWAVSSRGFNGRYANKLLVLIDGRSVYNPVFSGVFWDSQDVVLEDVERIEVIRGPGGTLWGANAVNGVISIITKSAKDTQGAYVMVGGGTEEKLTDTFRYGGKLADDSYYRFYGKNFERGALYSPTGDPDDAWRQGRFGFRTDTYLDAKKQSALTVQGDHYVGLSAFSNQTTETLPPYVETLAGDELISGQNLLARMHYVCDDDRDWTLQLYYDYYLRKGDVLEESVKTLDVDYQYHFPLTDRQKITCGAGFRNVYDELTPTDWFSVHFDPANRRYNLVSQFIQDEIDVIEDKLTFTMGVKLEENDFTGFEYQPSARLLWTIDRKHVAWGAISRAVRTPSRAEDNMYVTLPPQSETMPVFTRIYGDGTAESEALMAYEIGYRTQATDHFSWDVATFYNVYSNMNSVSIGNVTYETNPSPTHLIIPVSMTNGGEATTYGIELFANWTVTERWKLYGQYTFLEVQSEGQHMNFGSNDPLNQVYMRSAWDIRKDLEFDLIARYVDCLEAISVPSYISMDARLGWHPKKNLELAVVGQNLLNSHYMQYSSSTSIDSFTNATEVCRGVYGTITWRH
jgi:iron complex outermembrane recepter protein